MSVVAVPNRLTEQPTPSPADPAPDVNRTAEDESTSVLDLRSGIAAQLATPGTVADQIMEVVARKVAAQRLPGATYRLQFNAAFTFRDARELVPYLAALGITHCYASPYLKAREGSSHGYDILDHNTLNPEIGSEADYDAFVHELHAHGMQQILDVVPNHMGIAACDNAWWLDVLEFGPSSPYASFFDIDWMPLKPDLAHKVLLPILGDQFGKVLEDQQLVLAHEQGSFWVNYYNHRLPVATRSLAPLLRHRVAELERQLGSDHPHLLELQSILTAISHLPPRTETDPAKISEMRREKEVIKRRIADLCSASPEIRDSIDESVRIFNGSRGDPRSFDPLEQLLGDQAYRLSYWRVASDEINYRRFFDINELAAICVENPEVFSKAHNLILRLIAEGKVNGLRVDHPDGLYDPVEYLRRLQLAHFFSLCKQQWSQLHGAPVGGQLEDSIPPGGNGNRVAVGPAANGQVIESTDALQIGDVSIAWQEVEAELMARFDAAYQRLPSSTIARSLYVVVEKILEPGERLPENLPLHGTTGYEFLNLLNGIFVDRSNARTFDRIYTQFIRDRMTFRELVYRSKKLIMQVSMASEISMLGHQLDRVSEQNRWSRDFTLKGLTDAISEVIACFPVYRTYIGKTGVLERDRQYIEHAVARAKRRNPATSDSIFDFVRDTLLLKFPDNADESSRAAQRRFVGKFQQVTPPVMAKAVEDTACYVYNRLVSLNEVGGDPEKFGVPVAAFHQHNQERTTTWPYSLLATTTHDTKRGEDVRARINVLSEIPQEWKAHVFRWSRWNARKKTNVDGEPAPSRNDEYLLYQTLVGSWPFQISNPTERARFVDRIEQYMIKATREAKVHTSWISPNEPYEQAVRWFIAKLLTDHPRNSFLADFAPFARRVADYGIWNSLSQTLLKLTSTGVPDIYQGSEPWDLRLVDPDNRMPVDYSLLRDVLESLRSRIRSGRENLVPLLNELIASRYDGRIKLYVLLQALDFRRQWPDLFTVGVYIPLEATGLAKDHIVAFARKTPHKTVIVAVPRLCARITDLGAPPLGDVWRDASVPIPLGVPVARGRNILTGEFVQTIGQGSDSSLPVAAMLQSFPVSIIDLEPAAKPI